MYYFISCDEWRLCRSTHMRHPRAGKRQRVYLRRKRLAGLVMQRNERLEALREKRRDAMDKTVKTYVDGSGHVSGLIVWHDEMKAYVVYRCAVIGRVRRGPVMRASEDIDKASAMFFGEIDAQRELPRQ